VSIRSKHVLLWILLGATALAFYACAKKEPVVAKVGRYRITAEDFKKGFVQKWRGEKAAKARSFQDRRAYVDELVDQKLLVAEAYAQGLDKKKEVQDEAETMARRKSLDLLYQQEVVDKIINEDAIRHFYDRSGEELRGRHILIKVAPPDTSTETAAIAKARIDSIRQAILDGLDFKAAAYLYSEDVTTARDSGDLGWFSWGKMVDAFQEAAWDLKVGEVSQPVRSPYGWHLILVEERRPVPDREPYEQAKESIKNQMYRMEGDKLNKLARDYVRNLRAKAKLETHPEVWDMMRLKVTDPAAPAAEDLANYFTEEEKAQVAATYSGGKVTVQDIADRVGNRVNRIEWDRESTFDDIISSIVEPKLLEKDAESKGLVKKASKMPEIVDRKEQQIRVMLEKAEVTDQVVADSAEIEAYYLAHLGDFIQEEERVVREIFIKEDSAKAARIARRARNGEDFGKLTRQFNEKESTKAAEGRVGPFGKRRMGLIGTRAFELEKVGDIAGPISVGRNWSIIRLLEIIPSRTKTFDEARSAVERQWRIAKTEELRAGLKERLRQKFPVTIYDDVLAEIWVEKAPPPISADTARAGD
jgi:parvulin-like peptidyl-prolyl isomerase